MVWDEKELTKKEIDMLFNELNSELKEKRITLSVVVYGGSAFALYELRNSTTDIDVEIKKGEINIDTQKIIEKMAKKHSLRGDWLNESVSVLLSDNIKNSKKIEYMNLSNLIIQIPPKDQLLAMKIIAGRLKDKEDVKKLLLEMGIFNKSDIVSIVEVYFGLEYKRINLEENNRLSRFINEVLGEIKNET